VNKDVTEIEKGSPIIEASRPEREPLQTKSEVLLVQGGCAQGRETNTACECAYLLMKLVIDFEKVTCKSCDMQRNCMTWRRMVT
jgi:hypothetical protein